MDAIKGPITRIGFLPIFWANIPDGRFVINLPAPKIPTANPAIAAVCPRFWTRSGNMGLVAPCPIVKRNIEQQTLNMLIRTLIFDIGFGSLVEFTIIYIFCWKFYENC